MAYIELWLAVIRWRPVKGRRSYHIQFEQQCHQYDRYEASEYLPWRE